MKIWGRTAKALWDPMVESMSDDPFELAPIIEIVMTEEKRKKRLYQEVVYVEPKEGLEQKSNRPRKCPNFEAEETSLEGSPKSP